jgi:hypothetical protein
MQTGLKTIFPIVDTSFICLKDFAGNEMMILAVWLQRYYKMHGILDYFPLSLVPIF